MLTIAFWKGAAERAIKTFIQSFVATLLASIGAVVSAWEVPWQSALTAALGVSLLSAVLSLATSIGNADFTAGTAPVGDLQLEVLDEITTVTKYKPSGAHAAGYPVSSPHEPTEADPERYER